MDVDDFDFALPLDLIAQEPSARRETARLLVLSRADGATAHRAISDLPELLAPGDVVVVNDTRVFPARLLGRRDPSGGAVECLLVAPLPAPADAPAGPGEAYWEALVHPGQKLKPGARIVFDGAPSLHAEVLAQQFFGRRTLRLWTSDGSSVDAAVDRLGHVPLPPYIKRTDRPEDRERYQTVFARSRGSVAAPTAGLHFSEALVSALEARGIEIVRITLHVGYGTFQPVRVSRVEEHRLEAERYEIGPAAAASLGRALDERRRIVAVGTTTTRTLEAVALAHGGRIVAGAGETDLFIYPGFRFQVVGALLTNFHLPRSSLLMLVSAFAGRHSTGSGRPEPAEGRDRVLAAYQDAIARRYRFYGYGDAMLIL